MKRPEQELQKAIIQLMDYRTFPKRLWAGSRWLMPPVKIGDYLHHTPNGGGRSPAESGIFKAMGVRAGYPDLSLDIALVSDAGEFFPGWRCELKAGRGRQTPNQILWQERLERAGHVYVIAASVEEFEAELDRYLSLGKPLYRGST